MNCASGLISVHTVFEKRPFLDNIIMKLRLPVSYKHHEIGQVKWPNGLRLRSFAQQRENVNVLYLESQQASHINKLYAKQHDVRINEGLIGSEKELRSEYFCDLNDTENW